MFGVCVYLVVLAGSLRMCVQCLMGIDCSSSGRECICSFVESCVSLSGGCRSCGLVDALGRCGSICLARVFVVGHVS